MTKNLLLTGASTGLGVAIAVQAAQAGYKVYATMRDTGKRATLDKALADAGVAAEVLRLDVQDAASIEACVAAIIRADGRIDALINNAGVGFVRTTEQATPDDISRVMDINFTGVVRCVKSVLPHMRQQRAGRVISVSSVGGLVGQPFNEIYCASKFAVEGYMESLASYVGPEFNLQFSVIEPGGIISEFANSALKHFAATGGLLNDEYAPLIGKYMAGAKARGTSAFQTAEEVAAVVLATLGSDAPPVRVRTSPWGEDLCALKTAGDPDGSKLQTKVHTMFLGGAPA